MAVPLPPSPLVTDRAADVINATINPDVVADRSLADPVALFSQDYDTCNGIVSQMTQSIANDDSSNKRKSVAPYRYRVT